MAETENGNIGGSGEINEWEYKNVQSSSYASSNYSNVSIDALRQCPVEGMYNEDTTDLYDSESGTYPITGISRIMCIASSYGGQRSRDIYEFMYSLGIDWESFDDTNKIVGLPYNQMYYGIDLGFLSDGNIYSPSTWSHYPSTYRYSIGSTRSIGTYGLKRFSLLRGEGFIGWAGFTFDLNGGDIENIVATIVMIDTSKLTNLLGSFTTERIPEDDPQKGIPSISIGAAGDVVKKRFDEVQMPNKPTLGVSSTGALNVYRVGLYDLSNFMAEIFHTTTRTNYSGSDMGEMLATSLINIDKGLNDLIKGDVTQFVVDTHIIPCVPSTETAYSQIAIGGFLCDSVGQRVTSDYVDVQCGSITLGNGKNRFYDSFQDLDGCRYKLFLPFIGFVDINPSYIWSHTIAVAYRFNIIDGSCIAFVSSSMLINGATSIIGAYSGSCCVHMPITGQNYSNVISGMMQAVGGAMSGNPMLVGSGVLQTTHKDITMSNAYNASASFMGIRKPYLLIEKPTQNISTDFYEKNGGLINSLYKLSALRGTGFTKCTNVNTSTLSGIDKDERDAIKEMLEGGVYL